jgi:hypothetical protein
MTRIFPCTACGKTIRAKAVLLTRHSETLPFRQNEAQKFVDNVVQRPVVPEIGTIPSGVRLTIRDNRLIATGTVSLPQVRFLMEKKLMW